MEQPNWDRIQEIFHAALTVPRSELKAFVAKACEHDPACVREVNALLEAHDSVGDFLETPIVELSFSGSEQANTSSTDNLVGRTIDGRYLIEKKLGHGGMSQVYFARDLRVNRKAVVIKFLSQELLEHSYARQKFEQEVEALSRIRHTGVVEVSDKGNWEGRPYFVMQFIDGESLRSQIPSEGMNLERAASILKQIGTALEQAHQLGVFHRDLKPENILLRRGTDEVVLIDFGIAKVMDSVVASTTTNGKSAGTLMYMSPEQLSGEKVTAASDIYSMAVIAYEMVTGRRPFKTTSPARLLELQKKRVRGKLRRLREDLSTKAQAIILRALSFDPSARYEHASKFGDSLADALLASCVTPEKKQWFKVIRTSLLILVGVALISFGIYQIINWQRGRPPNRSFSYFLTVQRMRDGQPYLTPFKSHGEEMFESGDRFRLTVSTPVPAYLYIFNEGPVELNDTSFRIIYPRQATNNGSASLGANQSVQSDWITFRGPAGAENFWIAWSTSPVSELDAATSEAFKRPDGGLTGQMLVTVKQYLAAKESEIDAITYNYNANQTAVVRARRDMLVALAQFKHR